MKLTTPKPHMLSALTPIRLIGTMWQGKRLREVWDCKCLCGQIWAVQRDHLMGGRVLMCDKCKSEAKGKT